MVARQTLGPEIIEWYATDGDQFVDLTGGSIGD
jgi:hypothetical protein